MLDEPARQASVHVEAVGPVGAVLIQHGDHVRAAILLEADVRYITCGEKLLCTLVYGPLGCWRILVAQFAWVISLIRVSFTAAIIAYNQSHEKRH